MRSRSSASLVTTRSPRAARRLRRWRRSRHVSRIARTRGPPSAPLAHRAPRCGSLAGDGTARAVARRAMPGREPLPGPRGAARAGVRGGAAPRHRGVPPRRRAELPCRRSGRSPLAGTPHRAVGTFVQRVAGIPADHFLTQNRDLHPNGHVLTHTARIAGSQGRAAGEPRGRHRRYRSSATVARQHVSPHPAMPDRRRAPPGRRHEPYQHRHATCAVTDSGAPTNPSSRQVKTRLANLEDGLGEAIEGYGRDTAASRAAEDGAGSTCRCELKLERGRTRNTGAGNRHW